MSEGICELVKRLIATIEELEDIIWTLEVESENERILRNLPPVSREKILACKRLLSNE